MKKQIIKIILVIIWMGLIFMFSNDTSIESSKKSNGFIRNTISKIINDDSPEVIDRFEKPVRKSAHFCIYLILGLLVFNCFDINKKYILYSVIICLLYSISDEVHQLFIDGRSGEVLDVCIDTIGSFIGIYGEYKLKYKKNQG